MGSILLDHLAVAVEHAPDAWPTYRDRLGGRWAACSGPVPGFEFRQLEFGGGLKVEVLNPHEWEAFDFLRRFLDRSGPGPHHLTFKVPDLSEALERCAALGYPVVGVQRENPNWQEAFLHPADGAGVVIQLAQSGDDGTPDEARHEWPGDPETPQATIDHVAHAVRDSAAHLRRFTQLLGGTQTAPTATADEDAKRWTCRVHDVVWPNGARVRLLEPTDPTNADHALNVWLRDRPARIHHLACSGLGIETVIEPQDNLGTRIVVRP